MTITTFGAITIGTYSVTLEIFEISRKTGVRSIDKIRHRMELAKDAYRQHIIGQDLVEELCSTLKGFQEIMAGYRVDAWRTVATSSLREAENSLLILGRIRQETGLEVEILSNSEHRFLTCKAVASLESRFSKMIAKGTAVVDVDGGSIQISLFDKGVLETTQNIMLGNLRVRERLQPVASATLHYERLVEELLSHELACFRKLYLKDLKVENVILCGDFLGELIFRHSEDRESRMLDRKELDQWFRRILGRSSAELSVDMEMSTEYASLIHPSAIIYRQLIRDMDPTTVWFPGTHLARGVAYDYAEKKKLLKAPHDFEEDIISAARNIGRRYSVSKKHISNVDLIATTIFDALKKVHGRGNRERLLLRVAVMLHDVGEYVSLNHVAENSYMIIMNTEIIGLSHVEREMVALIVRYNRSRVPSYQELARETMITRKQYLIVCQLASLLRMGNALDRSHTEKIESIKARLKEEKLIINLNVRDDYSLEEGLLPEKQELFDEVFGIKTVCRVKREVV